MHYPRCEMRTEEKIEPYQIPAMVCFSILLVLVVFGTILDVVLKWKETENKKNERFSGTGWRCLKCFSLYTNFKKLMDVEAGSAKLKVLHGVRFYSICWIILGHTYYHISYNMLKNLRFTLELFQDASFNIITNATLVVDNFFFISGLLMTFVSYEISKKSGTTYSAWQFVVHRMYRFWPMQMTFVGITTLIPFLGNGPLWKENIDPLVDACKKDWWTNLAFVNNLYRSGEIGCVSHAWYLSADMQIYLLCLFVLFPLVRYPRVGIAINCVFIAASILAAGWYNYARDLPPTMLITKPDKQQNLDLMREIYYTPYHHLAPYCIGMFVGYYLHTNLAQKKIHPLIQALCWILSLVLTSSSLLGVHTWNEGGDPGVLTSAIYAAFSRVAWVLGLAWITWACCTGHGGIMTKFLTWKPLIPLSRMTFSVYLVHPYVQRVFYANIRGVIEARNYMAVFIWFGFLMVSYLLAVVVCMFVESPFINLGFVIFEKHDDWAKNSPKKDQSIKNNQETGKGSPLKKHTKNGLYKVNDLRPKSKLENGDGYTNGTFICHL